MRILKFSKKSIVESFTALLVFLFLYTGLSKYVDNAIFKEVLGKSPLLSSFKGLIAATLPGFEILLVLLLTLPRTRLLGLLLSDSLLILFTIYLTYMILFTPKLPCSCGGVISQMSWTSHIFLNFGFILITSISIKLQKQLNSGFQSIQPTVRTSYT